MINSSHVGHHVSSRDVYGKLMGVIPQMLLTVPIRTPTSRHIVRLHVLKRDWVLNICTDLVAAEGQVGLRFVSGFTPAFIDGCYPHLVPWSPLQYAWK